MITIVNINGDGKVEHSIAQDQEEKDGDSSRMEICRQCDMLWMGQICRKCGCMVRIKTLLKSSKCPIGKW